jgi:hypothetical protein
MYYDLIASLPHLPHFEKAEWLPISRLRLNQRLKLLTPAHAEQLTRAQSLILWRPPQLLGRTDADLVGGYAALMDAPLDASLREYVAFRMDQQTLMAALRRKQDQTRLPNEGTVWGVGPRVYHIRKHWDEPDFRLAHLYPWIAPARELLKVGDARGLERRLMDNTWKWLDRCAQRSMFGFEAAFSYFFKWDILQAWLAGDPEKATARFRNLIEEVAHAEHS